MCEPDSRIRRIRWGRCGAPFRRSPSSPSLTCAWLRAPCASRYSDTGRSSSPCSSAQGKGYICACTSCFNRPPLRIRYLAVGSMHAAHADAFYFPFQITPSTPRKLKLFEGDQHCSGTVFEYCRPFSDGHCPPLLGRSCPWCLVASWCRIGGGPAWWASLAAPLGTLALRPSHLHCRCALTMTIVMRDACEAGAIA
jgi:hypothetical protein